MQTKSFCAAWLTPIHVRSRKASRQFKAFAPVRCKICSRATDRHSGEAHGSSTTTTHTHLKLNGKTQHSYGSSHSKDTNPAAAVPVPTPDYSQPLEGHDAGNLPFTLHQLLAFKTVVSYGRQQTADMLGVTATNISLMLNKLEKDFDEQLLIRSKRAPLQRTPAGQLLLRYTDRMLGLCNDALTAAKDLQTVRTGTMVVGASQTTGIYLMPQLLEKFKKEHAEVNINLVVENTRRCCEAVARGDLDLAVVGGQVPTDLQHLLLVTPYQQDEVVLVCSKDHPLSKQGSVTKQELEHLKYVSLFQSSTVQAIRSTLAEHRIEWKALQVVLECNSVEAIKNAVKCNLGVAFVSKLAVQQEVDTGQLHALTVKGIPLTRSLRCVADPVRYQSRAVRALVNQMFGQIAESPKELPAPLQQQEVGCCSGSKVHTVEQYPALEGRGPFPSDLSRQKWTDQPRLCCQPDHNGAGGNSESLREPCGQGPPVIVAPGEKVPFTLVQVAIFLAVARTGGPTLAAQVLDISQPAVSKTLSGLEQVFGGRLVLKTARPGPALLTETGEAVLPYCQKLLEVAGEACKAMQDFRAASTGVVSLGASQTVGTYVMPRLIAAFKRNNPQVVVQLAVDQSRHVCAAVARGDIDVGIIGGHVPEELKDIVKAVPYAEDRFVLLVPKGHELAQRGSIDKCELYNLSFVSLNKGSTVQAAQEETLLQQGIKWHKLRTYMELNSVEAIKGAVQHGLGVAFVSVTAIEKELDLGLASCVSINGVQLTRTLRLVSNPRRDYSRIAHKFMVDVFGMVNEDANTGRQDDKSRSKPLRNVNPAARPWEGSHHAPSGGLGRPILQQVQNLRWRA